MDTGTQNGRNNNIMALELTVTEGGFQKQLDTWHPGFIDCIEETDHAQYGAGLKWILILDADEDSAYPETWAFSSQAISPGSKVHTWLTQIYGQAPATGAVIDLGKLFGERVAVKFAPHKKDPDKQIVSAFKGLNDRPKRERTTDDRPPVTNKDVPF
jgi:hypothetical protein